MAFHNGNGHNGLPKPEPVWLALGIVTWAMASAMAPTVRARFVEALERIVEDHEKARQIVAFDRHSLGRRDLSKSTRVAVAWVRRLIEALREARGWGT